MVVPGFLIIVRKHPSKTVERLTNLDLLILEGTLDELLLKEGEKWNNFSVHSYGITYGITSQFQVVRGLSTDNREKQTFAQKSKNFQKLAEQEGKMQAFFLPALVLMGITVLILAIGLHDLSNGEISIGDIPMKIS